MTKKEFKLRVEDIVVLKKNGNVITRPFFGDNQEMEEMSQTKEAVTITRIFEKRASSKGFVSSVIIKDWSWHLDSIDRSKPISRYNLALGAYEYHWVINKTLTV